MIDHNESTFRGIGEIDLYYQSWQPTGNVKAVLVIVHGLGGHSSKYNNIVQHFIPKQYAVYSFDLRGHGRSPGQRGYINAWAEFREDLRIFLELIQAQQPKLPIFLLGHSLGSIVVLDYVLRYPQAAAVLKGVILLAPSLGKVGVSQIKLLLGQLLSRIWPRFTLNTGLDLSAGARDEKVLAIYAQDTLRHTLGTARLATEFLNTVNWINNHTNEWQLPLLILHGGADRITLPEGSQIFYEQLTACQDKTRIIYPEAYHELQDDLNYQEVLADLESWLAGHLLSN
ncbi:lysophospholipase [Nostoc sp. FACHB-87]|uniref:alpha/beta hydrolase n=1 Tax=Nostocales TaxID=1161 RepID=UPI001683CFBA|nr:MULTISPECIES: alpha/beta hydrolase [Nostocales]MBD2297378.1 lysophospholipase [Nostoc sp. FACHB-190]MBD2452779.1 lysophospholipase [Nostoc sp. FACHB-87]MBD2473710.1 lysophospholipase [Anabaena sp. FACHB-83]MBD2486376.1 lysophospholipase [Aulosira sp. FACHB-615]